MGSEVPAFTLDDAHQVLEASAFVRWWGVRAEALGKGWATVSLAGAPHLLRPGGVLHGACYEVIADVAMWLAIMTRGGDATTAVTVEMKTNFLRGTGADLTSTATVLKYGRRLVVGEARTLDTAGRLVAFTTLTYARG